MNCVTSCLAKVPQKALQISPEPLSTFTLNASRSYKLLYFIYTRKASQMLLRNLRKIYATVEIQPRSQGLSSLPPLNPQNLSGRKICRRGGVFCRPLDQMYLSTHPPCSFGWIDGHVTSRNQGLCSND